ncbi:MAG: HAD family phosphatase [Candidatus Staskawiczbacteria bacterium]|jgi:putative hydrolase of the HAD superfamily
MNKKINTFIFDCFGVICGSVVGAWYKDNMIKRGKVDENLMAILEQFDLGKISEDSLLSYFLKYEGINATREELRKDIDSYLKLDVKLADIILELKNKGFKTMLLSNANASFFNRLVYSKYPQFKSLFDEIIISSEVEMTKPGKDIYLYGLNKINSKPEESLFIDDRQINIDGAINLGINGFLYTNAESFLDYIKTLDL